MAPEDGDPARRREGPDDSDEAFAATIAPAGLAVTVAAVPGQIAGQGAGQATGSTPPADLPSGTVPGPNRTVPGPAPPPRPHDQRSPESRPRGAVTDAGALASDATMAAPGSNPPADPDAVAGEPAEASLLPMVSDAYYRADREIARGGMGKIVAAEDQRLGRPVALKQLLEPAGDALGRFQREALITARLQHPGIVPVYEAGRFPNGEPFFAMKLVSGRPLDRVIAETHGYEERIALLPRIAAATEAIAYAHNQRVVHRDLKPGNVLIGEFGETVVIDWGLAKDLDASDAAEAGHGPRTVEMIRKRKPRKPATATSDSSTLTVAGAVMGTPAYMAPEQARGEPVDQRADVFALGAMLYHALAGAPPYNARTATDVIAAAALGKVIPLREREPSAAADLVAIVERAMAPSPDDRYQHAGELAEELRRFMTGQLVKAHDYTTAQRIARFVRKHRAAVTISAIAVVAFATGGTFAIRQIVEQRDEARDQRRLADTRREAAEKLIDRMLSDVKDRLVAIGRLDLLANLGGQIRDYYDTLATIPGGMPPGDLDRMATATELIGRAERDSGQSDRALKTWSQARDQLIAAVGGDSSAATFAKRRMIARLYFGIGTIHQQRGKTTSAIAEYTRARTAFRALRDERPDDRDTLLGAAETHDRIGDLLRNDGKIDQAFEEYSEAKAARERARNQPSSRPADELLALSTSHLKLGSVYQARGDSTTALAEYRASLRLRETVLEGQPDNVEIQEKVLDVQGTLAELQRQLGDARSAAATYQQALPVMDALLRRDPANTQWKRQRGNLHADLGFALLDGGEFRGGLDHLEQAIATQHELVARDPKNSSWQIDLSRSYTRAGDGQIYLGAIDDGVASYLRALELRLKLVERDPRSAPYRRSVAWSHTKLGNAHAQRADLARAIEAHETALGLRSQLAREAPNQSGFKNELAATEVTLGKLLAARDPRRAATLIAAGIARSRALVAGDEINNEWKEILVQGLLAQADAAKLGVTTPPSSPLELRRASLTEALSLAEAAARRAPHNAHWPGFVAEIHSGLAEVAPDARSVAASWRAVRDQLEPLARTNRLPATRRALLERARARAR